MMLTSIQDTHHCSSVWPVTKLDDNTFTCTTPADRVSDLKECLMKLPGANKDNVACNSPAVATKPSRWACVFVLAVALLVVQIQSE